MELTRIILQSLRVMVGRRMGEPQTKGALANQSHVGSGGYQDNTKMENKAARWQGEADNDAGMQEAVSPQP